ncbi:hypothetical protein WISP_92972 [Willisornis vidua]|uniref:Uncharacterized protein n=1 Tax=Willisornis vidua TaxID=1566151 RepID=A0ABQ9D6V5_9PASS|nr:hypothetical protein WISP_92972 [Willisornis vidua]
MPGEEDQPFISFWHQLCSQTFSTSAGITTSSQNLFVCAQTHGFGCESSKSGPGSPFDFLRYITWQNSSFSSGLESHVATHPKVVSRTGGDAIANLDNRKFGCVAVDHAVGLQ